MEGRYGNDVAIMPSDYMDCIFSIINEKLFLLRLNFLFKKKKTLPKRQKVHITFIWCTHFCGGKAEEIFIYGHICKKRRKE
jgi:hypothetical protein